MRIVAALLIACVPTLGWALSCAPPNAGREFNRAVDQDRPVTVVAGVLLAPDPPVRRRAFETVEARYRLIGTELSGDGRDSPFAHDVALRSVCVLDQWCGALPDRPVEAVFLLNGTAETGFALPAGPCPSAIHFRQGRLHLKALRRCLTDGRCGERELQVLGY